MKKPIKKLVNGVFGLAGLEVVRKRSLRSGHAIDPLERNDRNTLNRLWSDGAFKERYLDAHRKRLYGTVVRSLSDAGLLLTAERLIDVGCGPGFFLGTLRTSGYKGQLFGCDFSEMAIASARAVSPDATLFVHDVYSPLDSRYDVLTCMETLEHLLHPAAALSNLIAGAKNVVLTVPEGRSDSFRGHINFWSLESWEVFIGTASASHGRKFVVEEINSGRNLYARVWE